MSKIIYRVPTRQYAYIEIEEDIEPTNPKKIVEGYFELEDEYRKQADAKIKESKLKDPLPDVSCGIGKTRNEYLNKK